MLNFCNGLSNDDLGCFLRYYVHNAVLRKAMTKQSQLEKTLSEQKRNTVGRPKSDEKRQLILFHAGQLFMSQGFERTSMDAVAKASGVSKQTVYSHFNNKDTLYNAVIEQKCMMYQFDNSQLAKKDLALDKILFNIATKFIELLHDPDVMDMYSTVIGESKANPHMAELFYQAGPRYSLQIVSTLLHEHPQAELSKANAYEVALDFFNMLKGDYHMRGILNMPYRLEDQEKEKLAKRTTEKALAIIKSFS